jgi:hypothetical protein
MVGGAGHGPCNDGRTRSALTNSGPYDQFCHVRIGRAGGQTIEALSVLPEISHTASSQLRLAEFTNLPGSQEHLSSQASTRRAVSAATVMEAVRAPTLAYF